MLSDGRVLQNVKKVCDIVRRKLDFESSEDAITVIREVATPGVLTMSDLRS